MENEEIRVRLAPSPTGFFHIGSARAALFNYLFAKKNNGKFILRIEDTDKVRSKSEYEKDIEESLLWLGLSWDEGPETEGKYGPYNQSKRGEIYQKYIKKLLDEKKAYYCYCTEEELEKERKEQEEKHLPPKYSGRCRDLNEEEVTKFKAEGRKPTIRFKIEDAEPVKFKDLIHGEMEFDPKLFGDFIIVKSDSQPIFILAGAIDDGEMKISHVIRGDDHLSNTPKQILLGKALDLAIPEYGHLPMILNSDRTKMSKRKNPVSVTGDYKNKGYLPEAMVNFLVFLGWTPLSNKDKSEGDQQFFTLEELINEFDITDVGKSPAIFDEKKLDFFNGYYIRKMDLGELSKRCLPYLIEAGLVKKEDEMVLNAIGLVQERMKKLSEVPELTSFFFEKPEYDSQLLVAKKTDAATTKKALEESLKVLLEEQDFTRDSTEQLLRALAVKINIEAGIILWSIRVALSGKQASPGTFELLAVLGKEESLARIKTAINMLQ